MFKHNKTKEQLITLITENADLTATARQWALDNIDYLMKPMHLLGSSIKTEKGAKLKVKTAIMYLWPHNGLSKRTICPGAKLNGCFEGCLYQSGQLGMPVGKDAMAKRTVLMLLFKAKFEKHLVIEINKLQQKHGKALAVRLNGTSDIDWSYVIRNTPDTQHYDYTKVYARVLSNDLPNYHLTYSGSAFNAKTLAITARAINAGLNTAIAFNTKQLEGEFRIPDSLTSFDDTDARFLDNPGTVGALSRKGSNKAERALDDKGPSFFFNQKTYNKLNSLIATTGSV